MLIFRKPEYFWTVLWSGVALLLVTIVVIEHLFGGVTVGDGPRPPAKLVEARLLPAFTLPPEAQASPETVARPLFAPGRRPAPAANASAAPVMRKGQFVLTGITVAPDVAFAFLKEVSTGKTQSVKKGAQVNGITVDTIEARRIVLKQGEEVEDLSLTVQAPARVAAAPAPTGAVPPAPGAPPTPPKPPGAVPAGQAPVPPSVAGDPLPPGGVPPAGSTAGQPAMPAVPAPAPGRRRPWLTTQ